MATYQKYSLDLGPYQEGNLADVQLTMHSSFSMTGVKVTFQVRDNSDDLIIEKKSSLGTITIAGQAITIPLLPADTTGHNGTFLYEIDFLNATNQPFATIGGKFTIDKEVNKA